jgi:hypothetical protein
MFISGQPAGNWTKEWLSQNTCTMLNVFWFTDIFSCAKVVSMWTIWGNFSIIACYMSFMKTYSNWKVFYVNFKRKFEAEYKYLYWKQIFHSKHLWIISFSTYDIVYSQNDVVHFSKGILDWLILMKCLYFRKELLRTFAWLIQVWWHCSKQFTCFHI